MENLSKSQALMQNVDYNAVIENQILNITSVGFVPAQINVTRHIYDKMKSDFCAKVGIPNDSIEMKTFMDLPLNVQSADNRFNNSNFSGYVFPIVVTMELPADPIITHDLSDENSEANEETFNDIDN